MPVLAKYMGGWDLTLETSTPMYCVNVLKHARYAVGKDSSGSGHRFTHSVLADTIRQPLAAVVGWFLGMPFFAGLLLVSVQLLTASGLVDVHELSGTATRHSTKERKQAARHVIAQSGGSLCLTATTVIPECYAPMISFSRLP
jgi:hypothetical protein